MTNQNSNKPVKTFMEKRQDEKRQKIKNNALYVTAYVILMFWGLWAIETGIFDTKLDGPEISGPTECPSNGKLIFDPKHKCYDEISLEEAKQRFGAKAAEKIQDVYYMTVEKDENSGKYSRKCYLSVEGWKFCDIDEKPEQTKNSQNNSDVWSKNKQNLYNKAMMKTKIHHR